MIKLTAEKKVGIMVSLGLLLLAAMIIYLGQFQSYFEERGGYELKVLFEFTGGVMVGAPVRLGGVEVGRVKDIRIRYGPPMRVQLTLWLRPEVRVTRGAEAVISSANIMGDKYVEILPGFDNEQVLEPGSVIAGQDPVRLERLVRVGEEITWKLGEVVDSVRRIIGEGENEEALKQTIKSGQVITENLEGLTGGLSEILDENKEDINAIIENFKEVSEALGRFTRELEEHPTILLRGRRKKSPRETDKETDKERWRSPR